MTKSKILLFIVHSHQFGVSQFLYSGLFFNCDSGKYVEKTAKILLLVVFIVHIEY